MEKSTAASEKLPAVLRASSLPALVDHLFANVEISGRGRGYSIVQYMYKEGLSAGLYGGDSDLSLEKEMGGSRRRCGTLLVEHCFDLDGVKNNKWSFP